MWKIFIYFAYPVAFVLGILSHLIFQPIEAFYTSALIFSLRIVTYALFPFLASSIINSVTKILESRKLNTLLWKNLGFIALGNFFFSFLGGIATFIYTPSKLKISQQMTGSIEPFSLEKILSSLFPDNTLSLIFEAHVNFLPFFLFLILTGVAVYFTRDKIIVFKEFLNSSSRIFYRMNTVVVDLSFVSFFFLGGQFLANIENLATFSSFIPLLLYLTIVSLVLIFGIMPLVMRYLFGIKKSNNLLWSFRKTLSYSFLSGDRLGSLAFLIKESRENSLVPRYLSSFQAPIYALFFRGGNALVTIITFVTLIKSYSSLAIGLDQILALCFFVFLSSFVLTDGKTAFFLGIGWLGAYYGNNMDQAHLNLLPALLLIGGFSALLDTLINAYFLVGVAESSKIKSHYLA